MSLHPATSVARPEVCFRSFPVLLLLNVNPSYLNINGFIHRDIKAANLLIDDDGTVLLGDLGVAADLSEDSSHPTSSHSHKSYTVTAKAALSQAPSQAKRSSYASHTVPKPRIGKRKSFVGTVSVACSP